MILSIDLLSLSTHLQYISSPDDDRLCAFNLQCVDSYLQFAVQRWWWKMQISNIEKNSKEINSDQEDRLINALEFNLQTVN